MQLVKERVYFGLQHNTVSNIQPILARTKVFGKYIYIHIYYIYIYILYIYIYIYINIFHIVLRNGVNSTTKLEV